MIVFDTETTGLVEARGTPLDRQPHIIEIAAIKLDENLDEVGRYQSLVNPKLPLSAKITEITGLVDSDLADAPPFAGIYNDLFAFWLGEDTMVAHNVKFDANLLYFDLKRIDKALNFPWPRNHICTVQAARPLNIKRNLASVYRHAFKEDFADAHRAMPDVEALVRIVRWMRKEKLL